MDRFELVCIDMFQTLVDINTRIPFIWKRILKDNYTEQIAEQCAKLVNTKVVNKFHENVTRKQKFLNLKSIFEPSFLEITKEINIEFNPKEAVTVFVNEHGNATVFEDAVQFFQCIGNSMPICLVSDADIEMITPLLDYFNFDEVFISEEIGSYKNDPSSRIFKEVLDHFDIKPEKVIHIGDASSDVIGANKHGIKTCWINRHDREWRNSIKPDYIVKSLVEVIDIIEF